MKKTNYRVRFPYGGEAYVKDLKHAQTLYDDHEALPVEESGITLQDDKVVFVKKEAVKKKKVDTKSTPDNKEA